MHTSKAPNPLRTLLRNNPIPTLTQTKRMPNPIPINLHNGLPLIPHLPVNPRACRNDPVARLPRNPVVVRTPVEKQPVAPAVDGRTSVRDADARG